MELNFNITFQLLRNPNVVNEMILVLQGVCIENCPRRNQLVPTIQRQDTQQYSIHDYVQLAAYPRANMASNMNVLVNGQYSPALFLQPQKKIQLRIVQALINDILELNLPGCDMHLLALDEIFYGEHQLVDVVVLAPGSRADIAIQCMTPGKYSLGIGRSPSSDSLKQGYEFHVLPQKIASIIVVPDSVRVKGIHNNPLA